MKKEVIGILVCTFLISVAVAPAMNALNIEENEINEVEEQTEAFSLQNLPQLQVSKSNRINSIKLNPPQPAEWPPKDKCIVFGFGRISNPKYEFNGDEYYWSFNCEYVRCMLVDEYGRSYNRLFNNGEVRYLSTHVHVIGRFMFNFLNFYLVIE